MERQPECQEIYLILELPWLLFSWHSSTALKCMGQTKG